MRKITLLTTATLLSIACIGGQSLTAVAASAKVPTTYRNGNAIIISGGSLCDFDNTENPNIVNGSNCNINSIMEQILQCIPSQRPCPPAQTPDVETPDTNIPNTPEIDENLSYIEQVVELVNNERAKEGLAPLSVDKNVQAAAQVRAVECEQSFSHTRPNGSSFSTALVEQGVSYRRAGENIAWGQRSPEEVVNAWMNSEGHRANIMNSNFTKIGVGYYQNANGVKYWSQLFIG